MSTPARSSPTLELLTREPPRSTGRPPLLFVHGAYVGAWCWDEGFLAHCADRGYTAHAVSLRGHGESDGVLATASLDGYVADLRATVDRLDSDPVIVGHSMGGVVVQRYLKRYDAPAAALLASLPPQGMGGLTVEFALRDPLSWMQLGVLQLGGRRMAQPESLRRVLFSADVSPQEAARYARHLQSESPRVLAELAGPVVTGSVPRTLPTLVLGAGEDAIVRPWAIEATARTFDTEAVFVPGVAHALMLDTGWERVARTLCDWLDTLAASHPPDESGR